MQPFYSVTCSSPINIAVIKYWGKSSTKLNTPLNSSVSVTLHQDDLRTITSVAADRSFQQDRFWLNGEEQDISSNRRMKTCLEQLKALGGDIINANREVIIRAGEWENLHLHIVSVNNFPTAAGLASSASGFAALVYALAKLMNVRESFPGELSLIARFGSGSACRSLYGGLVQWHASRNEDGRDSFATQLFDEHHWPELRTIILVVNDKKKDVGSTDGMIQSVETSRLLHFRAQTIVDDRVTRIRQAYNERNFATFGRIMMEDSNQFHAVCLDTYPPIFYLNESSKSIIRLIHAFNEQKGSVCASYTFDAGPNAFLFTTESHLVELLRLVFYFFKLDTSFLTSRENLNGPLSNASNPATHDPLVIESISTFLSPTSNIIKRVILTKAGPGPLVLSESESLMDVYTGLPKHISTDKSHDEKEDEEEQFNCCNCNLNKKTCGCCCQQRCIPNNCCRSSKCCHWNSIGKIIGVGALILLAYSVTTRKLH